MSMMSFLISSIKLMEQRKQTMEEVQFTVTSLRFTPKTKEQGKRDCDRKPWNSCKKKKNTSMLLSFLSLFEDLKDAALLALLFAKHLGRAAAAECQTVGCAALVLVCVVRVNTDAGNTKGKKEYSGFGLRLS